MATQPKKDYVDLYNVASTLDLSIVTSRYAMDNDISVSSAEEVETELKRFLVLSALKNNAGYTLKSDPVDGYWHTFLMFSELYTEFCKKIAGQYIHHVPRELDTSSMTEAHERYSNFLDEYTRIIGDTPPTHVWPSADIDVDSSVNCYPKCACKIKDA